MILITSAMDEEAREIHQIIENKEEIKIDNYLGEKKIYKGEIEGHKIISLTTGIGKVNAAMWNSYIIAKYQITHIINSGTAGGLQESSNIKISDIIISSQTAFYDFNLTQFDYQIGQVPGFPQKFESDKTLLNKVISIIKDKFQNVNVHIGLILTGDQFIEDEKQIEKIKNDFKDALAVEMESAAIAQVAYTFNIPFIVTRSISDFPNNKNNHIDFNKFLQDASKNSAKMVRELIKSI
ncbi:5'-methylthioadenosine/adenosylhomocysteine nucleosidase [Borrelia recurrentis]|uniref:adenosylhomocysteine nucleosidase n=1 Tax=Borrelia recurrentis (strain A1) TaxID=412418 RepID=B5RRI4_BORRA|nr:5'-methylthioadenosine/adenosylhomocysteine nucleosidase [Borrelia recurrentis]ACH94618.1 5'-methylthioadenosine nucleosidase/S-adenosylhomocysteine [Borrelia recurrentis A1]